MTYSRVSRQNYVNSNYECILYIQEARRKMNMLKRDECKFLKDAYTICRDENNNVKDDRHTDGYIGGYIRLSEETIS